MTVRQRLNARPGIFVCHDDVVRLAALTTYSTGRWHSLTRARRAITAHAESEALKIRDQTTCVAVPFDVALDMENERGFQDLVAEGCWNEWQRLRLSMKKCPL